MPIPKSWVLNMPRGLREQPGWVFIGMMVSLSGIGFATGATTSAVNIAIGDVGLRVWGGILALVGALVVWATIHHVPAHEKLSLRLLALAIVGYVAWLLTVVPFSQASMAIVLATILIGLCEIRVGFLKIIINYDDDPIEGVSHGDD
jgi:hypothetical protein